MLLFSAVQGWLVLLSGTGTITCSKRRDHTSPLFKKLKLLKLNESYLYFVTLLMYKYHHSTVPQVVQNLFVRNSTIHEYPTRKILHVPKPSSDLSARHTRITGVKLYNHFARVLNWDVFYVTFKFNVKKYLLENDISKLWKYVNKPSDTQ